VAYFDRTGPTTFRATEHVGGAWTLHEQHIAPALGLLVHVIERDRDARRGEDLVVARLSYDILGTLPIDEVSTTVTVIRPGRTIELVEARLAHDERDAVLVRAWLLHRRDTSTLAGSALPRIPAARDMPPWDASSVWPGGFIATTEVRRMQTAPGRATFWVRASQPLVAGEEASVLARAVGLFDIANGLTVRAHPDEVAFPNFDLTAHLFDQPQGEWLGFDTTVTFGADGVGLTSSVLHDHRGPVGTLAQILTIRPA
jgi:hypothetical protein